MAAIPTTFALDAILPSEDLQAMGRKRYQRPSVLRTRAKGRRRWYFRYVRDVVGPEGKIVREEAPPVGRIAKMIERVM